MKKIAAEDSPLLTTPINSEPLVMGVWNKYFADKHAKIIQLIRANMRNDVGLQTVLTQAFPGFTWPELADMPTNNTFEQLKNEIDKLNSIPQVQSAQGVPDAIKLYLEQYNLMLKQLQTPQHGAASKAPRKSLSPKVKQLQELLGVPATGSWNPQTNTAFLSWLKMKGWDKYISGNRFTGNIDDAIRAMLIEKSSPQEEAEVPGEPGSMDNYVKTLEQKQSSRLERLKKLF